MIFGWLRNRRRKKLLARPFPDAWRPWLEAMRFHQHLDEDERSRLEQILRVIIAEKNWEGCAGLELTEEMQVVVAAQAALLVLEIDHDYYEDVTSILIFPTSYESPIPRHGQGGVVSEGAELGGEAYYRGPVILAWDWAKHGAIDPKDGTNLVLHEFAHRLDALDGVWDGTPPLHDRGAYPEWAEVMKEAYEDLQHDAHRGRHDVLDPYGAINEAEFFAVATEAFFEKPVQMHRKHPELYAVLRRYYRQDPLERLRRAQSEAPPTAE